MTQSNSSRIYDAYVAAWNIKNPSIIQPQHVSMFTPEYKELCAASVGEVETEFGGKCIRPSKLTVLVDGRAVETGFDGRGNTICVVFPSLEAARSYEKPSPYKEYFDRW